MFEDDRGIIEDLITEPVDSITRIFTIRGAKRGNHYHKKTIQWTYVISGCLYMTYWNPDNPNELSAGFYIHPDKLIKTPPNIAHQWEALSDTICLVFTKGPRSGQNYESDTFRV